MFNNGAIGSLVTQLGGEMLYHGNNGVLSAWEPFLPYQKCPRSSQTP